MGFIRAFIHRNNPDYCKRCGAKLTIEEKTYYIFQCESCEGKSWDEMNDDDEEHVNEEELEEPWER